MGARVLVQDSFGHTSLSAGSRCTAMVVRRYFQMGELPDVGKVCGVEGVPFGGGEMGGVEGFGEDRGIDGGGEIDRELRDVVWELMMNGDVRFGRGGV